MKGLLHFNTSLVTPTPPPRVDYSDPNLKDLRSFPPFSLPLATVNPLGCMYLQHWHSLGDPWGYYWRRELQRASLPASSPLLFTRYPEETKGTSISLSLFSLSFCFFLPLSFNNLVLNIASAPSDPFFSPH